MNMTRTDAPKIRRTCLHQHWTKILGILAVMVAVTSSFTPHSLSQNRLKSSLAARSRSITTTEKAPTKTSSSMPPRNPKHRKRREAPPTQQQVAHHVANQYLHGSGGVLTRRQIKRTNDEQYSQSQYLKMLDRHPSLLLNADYQPMSSLPLSLWHWQEAVKAVFSGKVTVVDVYDDIKIRAANLEVALPSVIALNEYVPQFNQRPAFTKRNVFLRDEYRCQYCTDRFYTRDLSLDHVVPRCEGGRLTWENAVTCCNKCNCQKGSLHVHQLKTVGMKLTREPFVPTQFQLAAIASKMLPQQVHPTWEPYLGNRGGKEELYLGE